MSKRILNGYVHLFRDGELVTLAPGEEVPEWATEFVTNPAVFAEPTEAADAQAGATGESGTTGDPAGDDLEPLTAAQLKKLAGDLGVPAKGNKEALKAAIRAKRDADKAIEPTASESGQAPSAREAFETRARELNIEFDENTTDDELESLIEAAA